MPRPYGGPSYSATRPARSGPDYRDFGAVIVAGAINLIAGLVR